MGKCKTCGGSRHVPSEPCLSDAVPCPTCSAPPPSSVPGEAGPYYFWLTEKFGGAHLMGPGIADFPVEVWYTPDNLVSLGNKAHAQGRASLLAELEASEKRGQALCAQGLQIEAELEAARAEKDRYRNALEYIHGAQKSMTATADKYDYEKLISVICNVALAALTNKAKLVAALTPSKEAK